VVSEAIRFGVIISSISRALRGIGGLSLKLNSSNLALWTTLRREESAGPIPRFDNGTWNASRQSRI